MKTGWMELATGKFSVPHHLLGSASVFYLCESLMLSHKALGDSGSKKTLDPLLLFVSVMYERRAEHFHSTRRQEQNNSLLRKPDSTGGMS